MSQDKEKLLQYLDYQVQIPIQSSIIKVDFEFIEVIYHLKLISCFTKAAKYSVSVSFPSLVLITSVTAASTAKICYLKIIINNKNPM